MRHAPASQLLGRATVPVGAAPREGTRLRAVYELFQASKGQPIVFVRRAGCTRLIDDLIDYYGLDIRCLGRGRWILAGEWFGRVYVDYVAQRLTASEVA
jgi:hypothetical protein